MSIIANTAVSLMVLGAITGTKINSNQLAQLHPAALSATVVTVSKAIPSSTSVAATAASMPIVAAVAPAPVFVTVQAGDTLSSIATSNGTTYTRLFAANLTISDPNVITIGEQITIPDPSAQVPDRALPATTASVTASAAVVTTKAVLTTSYSLPDDTAKAFIYSHESGNNPGSTSASGCYGLGQDCNGVVRNQCGADYACQDAYFTSYATRRYGSWAAAAAFWQTNGWW